MTIRLGATFTVACFAFAAPALGAPDENLKPKDFAYGRALQVDDTSLAVAAAPVPLDVYRAMREPGLRALMVFNAAGAQVPHAIRSLPSTPAGPAATRALPLFPLHVVPGAPAGSVALEIQRDAAGHVLRLAAQSAPSAAGTGAPPPIAAYVLDARQVERAIIKLRVQLEAQADERVASIRVEASEDLVQFVELPVSGALIQLGSGGNRIDRDEISIPPTRTAFYRLSVGGGRHFPTPVSAVTATLTELEATRAFEKVSVRGEPGAKPQVFRFDLGGPVPVDRVEFELPEKNTVVLAELFASDAREGPFRSVARTRLYRVVHEGSEERGPTLDIARRHERYYELRVDPIGGGLGAGVPVLVTHHTPEQLLFLQRGGGPFLLAYGSYRSDQARFDADDLLSLSPVRKQPTATASLGEMRPLGGSAALEAPKPPPPYATYALWAVLILGVALLGGLALRVFRSTTQR